MLNMGKNVMKISTVGMVKGSLLWTARDGHSPAIGLVYKRLHNLVVYFHHIPASCKNVLIAICSSLHGAGFRQNSIRYFSTESG